MSVRVSYAGSCLLRQAVHYLIVCVYVCVSVPACLPCLVWPPGCLRYAYLARRMCLHVRADFPLMFRSTWADGYGCVSKILCTCRVLVPGLQPKSSCCWSGVSFLCHDTKLIFKQLPSEGETWGQGVGWGDANIMLNTECYPWRIQFPLHPPSPCQPDRGK